MFGPQIARDLRGPGRQLCPLLQVQPERGAILSIELGAALDPYLYVLNADGTVFDENDDLTRGILN